MSQSIFDKIVEEDNFEKALKQALKGDGKYDIEAIKFVNDETYNLRNLIKTLLDESYTFSGYIRFVVFEPKERVIDAPHFKDKLVQLAINNVIKEVYSKKFIPDTYACIDGRGTHKCAERIQHLIRKAKWQYGENAYILKGDIKKFFYNIDREILKGILPKSIKCDKTLRLINTIIDSADAIDSVGLPLGNTLSQICANVYLNELDQFCKRRLSLKYYVRYMDDFIAIYQNKNKARESLEIIREFCKERLNLELNDDKSKIFPINQGVNIVGFKIHTTHKLLRNRSKKTIKKKIKAMPRLMADGEITLEKAEQMLNSWMGHAGHANSFNFVQSLLTRFDFLWLENKKLRINEKQLKEVLNGTKNQANVML